MLFIFPVDGEWADWSLWSGCSASCDSGQLTRQRSCSSPKPANGGNNCSGEAIEQQSCQVMVCPGIEFPTIGKNGVTSSVSIRVTLTGTNQ